MPTSTRLSWVERTARTPTRARATLARLDLPLPGAALTAVVLSMLVSASCAHNDPSSTDDANAAATSDAPAAPSELTLTAADGRPTMPGPADWFTGDTTVSMLFSPAAPRDFSGATVRFEPGARTAWHSHPAGQTLVVTEGVGWVQVEGGARQQIVPGDVVWTPPDVRHWHGATADNAMVHLALQSAVNGSTVTWFANTSTTPPTKALPLPNLPPTRPPQPPPRSEP